MAKKSPKPRVEIRESEPPAEFEPEQADDRLTSSSMSSEPSEDDIRMRAYQKFLERGGYHGNDLEDWTEAEQELKKGKR
jgi:hypothetical protein